MAGLPEESERVLERMKAARIPVHLETYGIVIAAYAKSFLPEAQAWLASPMPDEARRVLQLMEKAGVKPDTRTHATQPAAGGHARARANAAARAHLLVRRAAWQLS